MKNPQVELNTYLSCGCLDHQCHRCQQRKPFLEDQGLLLIPEPVTTKRSKKNTKKETEDTNNACDIE